MGCSSIKSSTIEEKTIKSKAAEGSLAKNNQKADEPPKKFQVTVSEVKTVNNAEEIKAKPAEKIPPRVSAPKIEEIPQKKEASPPKNVPIPETVIKSKSIEDSSPGLIKNPSLLPSQGKNEENLKKKPQETTVDQWLTNLYASVKSQLLNKV